MNIRRVKYKMNRRDTWKIGYIIGEYDGQNKTLLDKEFNHVPKMVDGDKEFTAYNIVDDLDKQLNITLPI